MPRFITVYLQCDWSECTVEAPEADGLVVERTLSIDGKQPRQFLLCKTHLDGLDEILTPLMQKGVKVEQPKRSTRSSAGNGSGPSPSVVPGESRNDEDKIDCQVDGCDRIGHRGLTNRTGMAQHTIRGHGYANLAAYEAEFGAVS